MPQVKQSHSYCWLCCYRVLRLVDKTHTQSVQKQTFLINIAHLDVSLWIDPANFDDAIYYQRTLITLQSSRKKITILYWMKVHSSFCLWNHGDFDWKQSISVDSHSPSKERTMTLKHLILAPFPTIKVTLLNSPTRLRLPTCSGKV